MVHGARRYVSRSSAREKSGMVMSRMRGCAARMAAVAWSTLPPGSKAGGDVQPRPHRCPRRNAIEHRLGFERQDDVGICADVQTEEVGRCDADHGENDMFDSDRAPDRGGGIIEQTSRGPVTEHRDGSAWRPTRSVVAGSKWPPSDRPQSKHLE